MKTAKGFTVIEMLIAVAIVGILSAASTPNFMKAQARAKQSEAKTNLKMAYVAQKAYLTERDAYSSWVGGIGFTPDRNNRYAYFFATSGTLVDLSAKTPVTHASDVGVQVDTFKYGSKAAVSYAKGSCGVGPFSGDAGVSTSGAATWVAIARGNLDTDATLDQWSISSATRNFPATTSAACAATGTNAAGEPVNEVNDAAN